MTETDKPLVGKIEHIDNGGAPERFVLRDVEGNEAVVLRCWPQGHDYAKHHAEQIVQRVNAYDDLPAALKKARAATVRCRSASEN